MKERMKFHVHGEYSINDAVSTRDMVKRASELGASAMTLTDHGSLMGIPEFMDLCKEYGIKGIPGIELYIEEDDDILGKKMHLILIAKDIEGYHQISKISTNSYKRLYGGKPRANKEMLLQYIKGSHVICSSACMQGVLAVPLLFNIEIDKLIKKHRNRISKITEEYPLSVCDSKCKALESLCNKLEELSLEKIQAEKDSKGSNTRLLNKAEKEFTTGKIDEVTYRETLAELDKVDKKRKESAKKAVALKEKIADLKKMRSELNEEVKKYKEVLNKVKAIESQIEKLNNSKQTEEEMEQNACKEALWYKNLFGDDFYVELQYHGLPDEAAVMPKIYEIGKKLGIKSIISNDAHFPKKEDSFKRKLLRMADFGRWMDEEETEKELYLKSDEELRDILRNIIPDEAIDESFVNLDEIEEKCNVVFEKGEHYPKFCENSALELRKAVVAGIEERFPGLKGWTKQYKERLEYELDVITRMGYADYHLIVADFLRAGYLYGLIPDDKVAEAPLELDELKKYVKENHFDCGQGIGPGRGSAVGSLVCYLLGITGIDPIKEQLLFERFLNVERVSMPDIDSDFSPAIRDKVMDYVKHKYGEDAVCGITTKGTRAARASVRDFAALRATKGIDPDDKKSITASKQKWAVYADAICKCIPKTPGIKLSECEANFQKLREASPVYNEIIDGAFLLEGTFASYGMHAAAVIISDNKDVSDYIPLMWNNAKERWTCQCNMVQAEDAGLLKMDFLGLKNLKIITDALRIIKRQTGKTIKTDLIPFEKEVFSEIYSKGRTAFVFQFESEGMRDMCKKFSPDKFSDIILLNAAYRPGPMQYLPKVIDTKHNPDRLSYLVPELEPILKDTYGSIIYQEQVMEIFRSLAGYSFGQADIVRRAMSKKKTKVLEKERESFIYGDSERNIVGCKENGIDIEKANQLFDEMTEFAKYAFNKSHAAAYSRVSVITAWLKYNYPKQYLCSAMNIIEMKKMPLMVSECKKWGITLKAPDINMSSYEFLADDTEDIVYFSLSKIKNIGSDADEIIKNRGKGYSSFEDFVLRNRDCNKQVVESLIKAGAFDSFSKSRTALITEYAELLACLKGLDKKEQIVRECELLLENFSEDYMLKNRGLFKEIKKFPAKRETLEKKLHQAEADIKDIKSDLSHIKIYDAMPDNIKQRLADERDMLGVYVSAHPMDGFNEPEQYGCVAMESIIESQRNVHVMGVIKDYKEVFRKSDGKKMCFFTLEDKSSEINVCVFADQMAEYEEFFQKNNDGTVVKILGDVKVEIEEYDEEIVQTKSLILRSVEEMHEEKRRFILSLPSVQSLSDPKIHGAICQYKCESGGRNLMLFAEDTKQMHKVDSKLMVSEEFIDNLFGLKVTL